jgi:hypothetical protein
MANLTRKTGTFKGTGATTTSFTVALTTIKTLVIYRDFVESTGLIMLTYDDTNGSLGVFSNSSSSSNMLINIDSKQLSVSGGSVSWNPYTQNARPASGVTYNWIAYGEE